MNVTVHHVKGLLSELRGEKEWDQTRLGRGLNFFFFLLKCRAIDWISRTQTFERCMSWWTCFVRIYRMSEMSRGTHNAYTNNILIWNKCGKSPGRKSRDLIIHFMNLIMYVLFTSVKKMVVAWDSCGRDMRIYGRLILKHMWVWTGLIWLRIEKSVGFL